MRREVEMVEVGAACTGIEVIRAAYDRMDVEDLEDELSFAEGRVFELLFLDHTAE